MSPPRTGPYVRNGQYPRYGQPPRTSQTPRTGPYQRDGQYQPGSQYQPGGQYQPGSQPASDGQAERPGTHNERPGTPAAPPGRTSQLIRQRDAAVPEQSTLTGTEPIAAIAPDGLDSFARDLRALRAKAELDYPEMAERSHYTMKTLASAAGGLRLPTLPVAMAFVRACDGDETEWEERWHKIAEKIGADKIDSSAEEQPAPGDTLAGADPDQPDKQADPGEVYVITSAPPRQPDW